MAEKTIITPKNIEKYKIYYGYRCLTATAIMNVLKQNFPARYFEKGHSTYVFIDKYQTMPDNFAKPGRDSCNVYVTCISLASDTGTHEIITNYELEMLFKCGRLFIRVDKSEKWMWKCGMKYVEIRNEITDAGTFTYYSSWLSHTATPPTENEIRKQKEKRSFDIVMNNTRP